MANNYKKEIYFERLKKLLEIKYKEDIAKINASPEYSNEQKDHLIDYLQKDYTDVKSVIENIKNITDLKEHLNDNSFHGNRFITKQELQEMFARNDRY